MDRAFLGQLDNHVQEINKSIGGKAANDILLKTIKLLLEELDYSDSVLAGYDKMEMRKLFSSFGRVSQAACDFYQASKGYLDPDALKGEIGQRLETTTKKVTEVNASLESIGRTEADLLKKEEELRQANEKYIKLMEKVSELKKIEETVSDDVLKTLENEAAELRKTIEQNKGIKTNLENQIKELENARRSLSQSLVRANADKEGIEENIIDAINEKIDIIRKICEEHSGDLDCMIHEIEKYKEQFKQLDDNLKKIRQEQICYKRHLDENSGIVTKMKEYGISGIDAFLTDGIRIEDTVKKGLHEFDYILKSIIELQEKSKDDIEKLE